MAHSHQRDVLDAVGADDLAYGPAHAAHVVTAGDVAITAEAGQVAPELGGGDADQRGGLVGVDVLDLVEAQFLEFRGRRSAAPPYVE